MAIRNILIIKDNNEFLRKSSKPVSDFSVIGELLDDMKETLLKADGLGLAAPQVGVLRRAVVVNVDGEYLELINPEIKEVSGQCVEAEGCLSVPGRFDKVIRPKQITVIAYDRGGKQFTKKAKGWLARAICHEIDHLNGVLFIDKIEKGGK